MPPKKPAAKPAAKPATKAGAKAPAKGAAAKAAPAPAPPPKPKALPVVEIGLKQLNVVLGDTEGKVKESGRWPIIVDEAGRVMVFLRHRDCNVINVLDMNQSTPDMLRQALLGALRYGKPLAIDINDGTDIDIVADRFNENMPGLWDLMLTKKITEDEQYLKLVRPNDDADYQGLWGAQEAFSIVFISSNIDLKEETKGKVIIFHVV